MKLCTIFLAALTAGVGVVNAQYFSSGWKPGQPATKAASAQPTAGFDPRAAPKAPIAAHAGKEQPGGFVDRLLTSGPLASIFARSGVNITATLEAAYAAQSEIWDMRIPFVTDDNYGELIENEQFASEEEERDRIWFLIITAQAGSEPMSKFADNVFDKTYNVTVREGDLPNVRFGRINYLDVTYLTTKWAVWRAPYLVVATNRGRTLRFYRTNQIRMDPESLHRFLQVRGFDKTAPWASAYAPGGAREPWMHTFADYSRTIYSYISRIPKLILIAATGFLGSILLQFFHRGDAKKAKADAERRKVLAQVKAREAADSLSPPVGVTTATSSVKASPAKKRKGGKK